MTWRKHFKVVEINNVSPLTNVNNAANSGFAYRNYQYQLPEVYIGHPNRLDRYNQYESMDLDSEVNSALDILAEFCTQTNAESNTPFDIKFKDTPTDREISILKEQLQQWVSLNQFNKRAFKLFRNTLKYGDQVFLRDPETFELFWVEMSKVVKVIVNESKGKEPEQYVVKDMNPNFQNLTATQISTSDTYANHPQGGGTGGAYVQPQTPYTGGSRFTHAQNESAINAEHVVHLSLSEGLDINWPFGNSILEQIFKVFKQKELLEDAIIIYRIQRAPERRIFKIDVGNMPSHMAMAFVERIKNEVWQRRIPTQTGGGANMMDATYNPMCLDLGTKIPLLDGRTLTLTELIAEFDQGKKNWAYSCDPQTGKVVPGLINWAGVTRKNTEVIKLTFDNGKTLICTPDHKIPVFGKGFVEAKDLTIDDSLIAFNTQNKPISGGKTNEYQQVWDHESKTWKWTHRIVGEFFRNIDQHEVLTHLTENQDEPKVVIHHKDHNRFNNNPDNLAYMGKKDHVLYHADQKQEYWSEMSQDERTEITGKISNTVKSNWTKLDPSEKERRLEKFHQFREKANWMRVNDPVTKEKYRKNAGKSRREYIQNTPGALDLLKKNLENRVKIKNQNLNLTFEMLQIVVDAVKSGITNKNAVIEFCDNNTKLLELVKNANSDSSDYGNFQCKIDFEKFGYSKLNRLLRANGYKNWKTFVKEVNNFNHRIVKIEKVSNRDVGTLTIDGLEQYHSFHTFAIDSGIFVKNSINEDYFFPVGSDGRGSDVTTLPGGQNLGEIDDLRFFTNKLFRGLRIPSSYLPTGPEDGSQTYNDGKVGTALIQEWRFNQYCKRLQNLIADRLDQEFKMFCRWRGVNIDSSLFDLTFSEPQNFAKNKQVEIDNSRISSFAQIEQLPYLSKRFLLKRYLGLSEEEMAENEKLISEEKGEGPTEGSTDVGLRAVGVTPGGLSSDEALGGALEAPPPGGEMGAEIPGAAPAAPGLGAAPAAPGAAPT